MPAYRSSGGATGWRRRGNQGGGASGATGFNLGSRERYDRVNAREPGLGGENSHKRHSRPPWLRVETQYSHSVWWKSKREFGLVLLCGRHVTVTPMRAWSCRHQDKPDRERDLNVRHTLTVMAERMPAIFAPADEARMAGTSPAMTVRVCRPDAYGAGS